MRTRFAPPEFDFKVRVGLAPEIVRQAKRLRRSLNAAFDVIIQHAPQVYPPDSFSELRFRIFPFPQREDNREYFMRQEGMQYVCLDSKLVKNDFHTGFEYLVHGITHSFSVLEESGLRFGFLMEEMFCELVGYRACAALLHGDSASKIVEKVRSHSPPDYNKALEVAESVERLRSNFFAETNARLYKFASRNERLRLREALHRDFVSTCEGLGIAENKLANLQARLTKDTYQEFEANFRSI